MWNPDNIASESKILELADAVGFSRNVSLRQARNRGGNLPGSSSHPFKSL